MALPIDLTNRNMSALRRWIDEEARHRKMRMKPLGARHGYLLYVVFAAQRSSRPRVA
jgi:hypothetical protein